MYKIEFFKSVHLKILMTHVEVRLGGLGGVLQLRAARAQRVHGDSQRHDEEHHEEVAAR
jgi:hypothetical protein